MGTPILAIEKEQQQAMAPKITHDLVVRFHCNRQAHPAEMNNETQPSNRALSARLAGMNHPGKK